MLANPWNWAVPAAALLAMAEVWALEANRPLFLLLNRLAGITGDALWSNLTVFGDVAVVFTLMLFFAGRDPRMVAALMLAAVPALLWVHGFKAPLGLPRPAAVLGVEQIHIIGPVLETKAFPSGHTATAFTLAGVLCLQSYPTAVRLLVLLMALLVGLSRVAVGAHWPLDVLGGAFGGWLAAVAGVWLAGRWSWSRGATAQRAFALLFVTAAVWLLAGHDTRYPHARWLQYGIAVVALLVSAPRLYRLFLPRA